MEEAFGAVLPDSILDQFATIERISSLIEAANIQAPVDEKSAAVDIVSTACDVLPPPSSWRQLGTEAWKGGVEEFAQALSNCGSKREIKILTHKLETYSTPAEIQSVIRGVRSTAAGSSLVSISLWERGFLSIYCSRWKRKTLKALSAGGQSTLRWQLDPLQEGVLHFSDPGLPSVSKALIVGFSGKGLRFLCRISAPRHGKCTLPESAAWWQRHFVNSGGHTMTEHTRCINIYAEAWERWNRSDRSTLSPRRDLELDAIAEIIAGTRLIHCHSYRQDEILAFLRVMESFGVRVATLQHILEGYKVADEIARHGAGASAFSDWWGYKFEVIDAIPYAGSLMHQRGVNVSFNSDSSDHARRLNTEAAKAVKYGGTPEHDALRFVTLNPARQLRIDDRVG
jgi:hypothetical protein